MCSITISDAETGEVVATPVLRLRAGEQGSLTVSSEDASGQTLRIEAVVDAAESSAVVRVMAVDGEAKRPIQGFSVRFK